MSEKYQKALAQATVRYLEKEFLKSEIQTLKYDRNGMLLNDSVNQYQSYFNEHYDSLNDDGRK